MDFSGSSAVKKNLPAKAEDASLIPAFEHTMENEMTTHSSILAWEIPWTESPAVYIQSLGLQKVGHNLVTKQ